MSDEAPLFNPSDFQSAQVVIKARNITSNTRALDPESVLLLELMDKGVKLEMPARSCTQGHQLELELTVIPTKGHERRVQATGKIIRAEVMDGGAIEAEIEFIQFVTEEWKQFQEVFAARQSDIDAFLNSARGMD